MKRSPMAINRRTGAAFTLIEMIGVMAIMAIMAGVLLPNVLKSIENAAVKAEADTIHNLGEEAKLYLRDNSVEPTAANWNTVLATYASLNPTDLLTNKRQMNRIYVPDPVAANQRALLVSSMRTGIALPTAATISANFSAVWNWNPLATPFTAPPGWGAWNVNNAEFLVIERINFAQVYRTDLASYTVILNNQSVAPASRTVSFQILNATGTVRLQNTLQPKPALNWQQTVTLGPKERLNLFSQATYSPLDYSYIGTSGDKTFEYTDTQ